MFINRGRHLVIMEQKNYREFKPELNDHQELVTAIESYLKNQNHRSTPQIYDCDEIKEVKEKKGWKKSYLRYRLLPGALNWMYDKDKMDREARPEGGQETHYWKVIE